MNAQSKIVENYYRMVKKCFTITDIKVSGGNNRQFDILAYRPEGKKYYHIEVGVTHRQNWCPNLNELKEKFRKKFFGKPQNKRPDNNKTDFAKGKNYLNQIKEAYSRYGIDYDRVIRIWCFWTYKGDDKEIIKLKNELAKEFELDSKNIETLSFRDDVLPALQKEIGTSNYDDETIRTLSLLKEYNKQRVNTEQVTVPDDKSKGKKNNTKYSFDGSINMPKNRLVLAIVRRYLEDHPKTYQELSNVFPKDLQGSHGVLKSIEDIEEKHYKDSKKRYFMKSEESLITKDNVKIAVCNQWGKGKKNNIDKFIRYATEKLKYKIKEKS